MKILLPMVSLVMLFSVSASTVYANEGLIGEEKQETDQVIVKLKDDASISLENSASVASSPQGDDQLVSLEVPENQTVEKFIEGLEKHEDIESVEPDYLVKLDYSPNDPDIGTMQYHHRKMETKLAWDKTRGSADVIVAVIDNGIDSSHPELKTQIFRPYDTVKDSSTIAVGEHGTHVAGIIAGSIDNGIGGSGIAPTAKIMPINVFDGELAYTSEIIQGIYRAVAQGADIINLSLGGYAYSSSFNDAIQAAHKKGVLIVAAAGNENIGTPYYPASYANVISVASTTAFDKVSSFSNFGKNIDIAAPGTSIHSTLPKGTYGLMSGTSMASPMVSGVAALIKANEPALNNIEIENRIYSSADDLGVAGKDPYYGHGRLNARKALMINYLPVPYVSGVFDYSVAVKGTTQALATVTVQSGSTVLNSGIADNDGRFKIAIPKQKIGTKLTVTSKSGSGLVSKAKEVIVKDGTPPSIPTVNPVSSASISITGKAEENAKVTAYVSGKKIGEAATAKGLFKILIAKQKPGAIITVIAVDAAGNKSAGKAIKVSDKTAPAIPTVHPVGDNAASITGKAESNAKVFAYAGTRKLGETIAKSGAYSIKIAKQKAGTAIAVYAVDAAGNKSGTKNIKVLDKTAPAIPTVHQVKNNAVAITGKAESNAKVMAYAGKVKLGETTAKSGAYSIKIAKQKTGTAIRVYAVDAAKNKSTAKTVKVVAATKTAINSNLSTTANVNMRSGASTKYQVLTVVPKGAHVEYLAKSGSWYKVKYGAKIGWVSEDYIKSVRLK